MGFLPGRGRLVPFWRESSVGKRVVLSLLAVLVLAVVIFVAGALSQPSGPKKAPRAASTSPEEFRSAMDAARSGDTTKAVGLLEGIVLREPANQEARRELDRLKQTRDDGETGAGDPNDTDPESPAATDPPSDTNPPDDDSFLKPVDDIESLLPKTVSGYDLGARYSDSRNAEVTADPTGGSATVRHATLFVHDFETASAASAYPDTVMKSAFPKDAMAVTVAGHPAAFRTDGGMGAAVVLVRGRYVFEVLLTMERYDVTSARAQGVAIAAAFPTKI